jgi:polyisoprenoid-binding protein YceI
MMSDGKRSGVVNAFRVPLMLAILASASAVPATLRAQSSQPNGLPPGVYMGEPDTKDATAGTYALDPDHAAVIARVSHLRYSYSIFRFDRVSGTLKWDPANPAASSLSAKVETASITSNVKGFGEQLAGDDFLKARAFPEATFVSTAFRQMSTRRGKVDGQLTLMGKTRPVTFDVELVGAGKGFGGQPRIGVTARTSINPVDFGLPALLGDAIEIVVDTEFQRNP